MRAIAPLALEEPKPWLRLHGLRYFSIHQLS